MAKRPAFQFYPADWDGNTNLKFCSYEEHGIWLALLRLFHGADEYGILRCTIADIQKVLKCKSLPLQNLIKHHVLKGSDTPGAMVSFATTIHPRNSQPYDVDLLKDEPSPLWFSSRMLRDEYLRNLRGSHGIKSLENPAVPRSGKIAKDIAMDIAMDTLAPSIAPSPTATTTSTTTNKEQEPPCIPPSSRGKNATQLPDNFMYNDKHAMLATELGVNVMTEFEHFKDHHLARGSTFKNWNFAFNTWLRNAKKFSKGTKPHGQQESYIDMLKRAGETLTRMRANPFPEIQVDLGGEVDEKHH